MTPQTDAEGRALPPERWDPVALWEWCCHRHNLTTSELTEEDLHYTYPNCDHCAAAIALRLRPLWGGRLPDDWRDQLVLEWTDMSGFRRALRLAAEKTVPPAIPWQRRLL